MINKLFLVSAFLIGSSSLFAQSNSAKHLDYPADGVSNAHMAEATQQTAPASRLTSRGTRPTYIHLDASTLPGTVARLFSLNGREIAAFPLTGTDQQVQLPRLKPGEYILRVEEDLPFTRSVMVL